MIKNSIFLFIALLANSGHSATLGRENCRVVIPREAEVAKESVSWSGACANGYAEGSGELLRRAGWEQIGSFKGVMAQGMMANGYEKLPDGDQYEGQYKNGLRDGRGSWLSARGDSYDGEWKAGRREGAGIAEFELGGRIDGRWHDDKPIAGSKLTFAGGRTGSAADLPEQEKTGDEAQRYTLRQYDIGSADLFPAKLALNSTIPFDKSLAEMTPQQQQQFRSIYPLLHADDVPPYPEKGTAQIYRWLSKAQDSVLAEGLLRAVVDVGADGKATGIRIFASPDKKLSDVVKAIMFEQKFSPALCSGKPCAMRFPFAVEFGVSRH